MIEPFGGTYPTVAIIGCGFAGIGAGVRLKQAGIDTFTIFERSAGVGGVWWDNDYPGAAVDVASHLYSFSFKPYDWERTHATRSQVKAYLEETVDDFDLRRHLRLGTSVVKVVWDEATHLHTVHLGSGEQFQFNVVVTALGFFSDPAIPNWPGSDDFNGIKFHCAHWEPDHDLSGKRVAVVGVGCTSVQVVPRIAPVVGELFVFQRQPGWIDRKIERDFTEAERRRYVRWPILQQLRRMKLSMKQERWQIGGLHAKPGSRRNKDGERKCREFIDEVFADRPDLKARVTPEFDFAGKRVVFCSDYYPTLKRDNVELVPFGISRLTRDGVVDASGVERKVDAILLATGFKTARFLSTIDIVGRDGRSIHDVWGEDAHALIGATVPGFPNLYMLYGPNTNGGNVLSNMNFTQKYIISNLKLMKRKRVTAIEPKQSSEANYNAWLQRRLSKTTWAISGANNYYKSSTGRVVTQWPDGAYLYAAVATWYRLVKSRVNVEYRVGQAPPQTRNTTGRGRSQAQGSAR